MGKKTPIIRQSQSAKWHDKVGKVGENGRKAVVEKYNWETESRKFINLYEDLLKGR